MEKETRKPWFSRTAILIVASCIIVVLGTLLYLQYSKTHQEYTFDMSFEMIDPQNPESTADEVIRLRRDYTKAKTERICLDRVLAEIHGRDTLIREMAQAIPVITFTAGTAPTYDKTEPGTRTATVLTNEARSVAYDLLPREVYDFFVEKSAFTVTDPSGNVVSTDFSSPTYNICNGSYRKYKAIYRTMLAQHGIAINPNYLLDYMDDYGNYDEFCRVSADHSDPDWRKMIEASASPFTTLCAQLQARRVLVDTLMSIQKRDYNKKLDNYRSSRLDINDKAIKYGIIAFCVTALTMYIAGLVFRSRQRKDNEGKDSQQQYEEYKASIWYSVYLITVLLLIITIFILGLARLLGENSLAALLGGIAGYVLNNKMGDVNGAVPKHPAVPPVSTTTTTTTNTSTDTKP